MADARAYFGDRVDAYVDGGRRDGGTGSTVVEFVGDDVFLRREGALGRAELGEVVRLADDA